MLSEKITMDTNQTINILKDAVSIMIPVITGFVGLFGISIGKLWQTAAASKRASYPWRIAGVAIFTALISLFTCFGVMGICIKASLGEPGRILWLKDVTPEQMARFGRWYLNTAYIAFSIAIGLSAVFFYRLIRDDT
jgi:hypothetical protein